VADDEPKSVHPEIDAYAERVIGVMRELGLPGNIAYDRESGRLLNESMEPFYLMDGFAQIQLVPEDERDAWLRRFVGVFLERPRAPKTWEEAKEGILPRIRPRMAHVLWGLRHQVEGLTVPQIPYGDVTEHLVVELAWPVPDAVVAINRQDLERWGTAPEDALEQAGKNLLAKTSEPRQWLASKELPGVLRSPWRDRFDATRVLFASAMGLPLKGPPVCVATAEGCLLLADGDDEDALFHLGLAARRELERTKIFLWLRPLRLGSEEEHFAHWLPESGRASRGTLSLLWAINDKADYDQHGKLLDRFFEREKAEVRAGQVEVIQGPTGAGATVAVWTDTGPLALPRADFVAFRREQENLALVPFPQVEKDLADLIQMRPGYPPRYLTTGFPQDWQLDPLRGPEA
jgi:hypothetical protein